MVRLGTILVSVTENSQSLFNRIPAARAQLRKLDSYSLILLWLLSWLEVYFLGYILTSANRETRQFARFVSQVSESLGFTGFAGFRYKYHVKLVSLTGVSKSIE
jgi:hypothetical protein